MSESLKAWAHAEFLKLDHPNSEEILSYLFKIEDASFLEEYLNAMLHLSIPSHRTFIIEFIKRWKEVNSSLDPCFHRKPEVTDEDSNSKGKNISKDKKQIQEIHIVATESPSSVNQKCNKKKTKYVSIFSEDGQNKDVILLPGRHICNCQASVHKLINNCLQCGRIVCEQEGSGPCAFCQNLVVSKEEKEIISKGTKKAEALYNKLSHVKKITVDIENQTRKNPEGNNKEVDIGLQKALHHRNQLLEYDKTSEKTKIYDDESDYFQSSSPWIKPSSKEKLQKLEDEAKQKKYDKTNRKFTFDIIGRKVVPETSIITDEQLIEDILGNSQPSTYINDEEYFKDFNIEFPIYIDSHDKYFHCDKGDISSLGDLTRLQDRELQEMSDNGICLSMHQPWASLLVNGIKIHEGRTWYSSHRGRLWIASTSKLATKAEISEIERTYQILLHDDKITFPSNYPAGCLLGCVDVRDVLPQEGYRLLYPDGESDSPYVFICENPQQMIIKFPIKGRHKLYKIDSKIHLAAKKSLRPKM